MKKVLILLITIILLSTSMIFAETSNSDEDKQEEQMMEKQERALDKFVKFQEKMELRGEKSLYGGAYFDEDDILHTIDSQCFRI